MASHEESGLARLGMWHAGAAFLSLVTPLRLPLCLLLVAASACVPLSESNEQHRDLGPPVMLWAWERPEDLTFLGDQDVGVAFLASTIRLRGDTEAVSPRRQPLRLAPTTWRVAVIRIESAAQDPGTLSAGQRQRVVTEVLRAAALPEVRGVQVDFDAGRSQRDAYRILLAEVRSALPESQTLSMTALASWCVFDRWLGSERAPADEVVPMLFGMGSGGDAVWQSIDALGDLRGVECRRAVGVQGGRRLPAFAKHRRVYAFSERGWDRAQWDTLRKGIGR